MRLGPQAGDCSQFWWDFSLGVLHQDMLVSTGNAICPTRRVRGIGSDVSGHAGLPDHGDWAVVVALVNESLTVLGFAMSMMSKCSCRQSFGHQASSAVRARHRGGTRIGRSDFRHLSQQGTPIGGYILIK